ncbi:unnamed protein product [Gulo gulo]|uniref:Uncharacterized protein n=1 Tax=Gulo gulo TaxID=48420 RepID=A0A9X9M7Z9_GULGU|nr:unnamed protein product [Gulo gulo]
MEQDIKTNFLKNSLLCVTFLHICFHLLSAPTTLHFSCFSFLCLFVVFFHILQMSLVSGSF